MLTSFNLSVLVVVASAFNVKLCGRLILAVPGFGVPGPPGSVKLGFCGSRIGPFQPEFVNGLNVVMGLSIPGRLPPSGIPNISERAANAGLTPVAVEPTKFF